MRSAKGEEEAMETNSCDPAFVSELKERLGVHGYTGLRKASLLDVGQVSLIMTPRRWSVRNVCAVAEIPPAVSTVGDCKMMCERIRQFIINEYALFPYWKEIGMYFVLFCAHELYEEVSPRVSEFYHRTGFHINVILGTVFVDKDERRWCGASTWGLLPSSQHRHDSIQAVVDEWCNQAVADPAEPLPS